MASRQVQHLTESWPFSTELEGILRLLQEDCLILSVRSSMKEAWLDMTAVVLR